MRDIGKWDVPLKSLGTSGEAIISERMQIFQCVLKIIDGGTSLGLLMILISWGVEVDLCDMAGLDVEHCCRMRNR
jgi:hypothetical protein